MFELWEKYPKVENDLDNVKKIITNKINSGQKTIDQSILELLNSGGKLMRPAFVLLGNEFGNKKSDDIYKLASIVELLHMATLIHDDIIDNSNKRRGIKTTHLKYGSKNAVFIGDYLFTVCFDLLTDSYSTKEMKLLSKVISNICLGEIKQNNFKNQANISAFSYLKMISKKTAALFSLSLFIGGYVSNADRKTLLYLRKLGYYIGMAFQIQDDILDFTGNEFLLGKDLGNDLKENFYSIPIIYFLKENPNQRKTLFESDIDIIITKINDSKAIYNSKKLVNRYILKAQKILNKLPDNLSKTVLEDIVQKLNKRKY
ncbi:MAG: polyprenyl synthetase family protein [Bacillota bacterium]